METDEMFRRRVVGTMVVDGDGEKSNVHGVKVWGSQEWDGKGKRELLKYMELPDWMKDNEFIHGMYRPCMSRLRDCFTSGFFTWHNESVNIWSHFLGFVFFLSLTIYTLAHLTNVNGHFSQLFATAMEKCGE